MASIDLYYIFLVLYEQPEVRKIFYVLRIFLLK